MPNVGGVKWTKGGAQRRGNAIYLEGGINANPFAYYIEELDKLKADLKEIVGNALEQAGETITEDTVEAVQKSNLPAQGKYSKDKTVASIIMNPSVEWSGSLAELPVGFDKTKPGAGGWLITGTPRMRPDYALERIYVNKRYANRIQKDIEEVLKDELNRRIK